MFAGHRCPLPGGGGGGGCSLVCCSSSHEKSRKSWEEPGTTTVALVDAPAVDLSSMTIRPRLGGEEYTIGVGRRRATGVTGGLAADPEPSTRSLTRLRRPVKLARTTGSLGSTKEVCGVDCAMGATPSMLTSKTQLMLAMDCGSGVGLARTLKMPSGV